jgi:hypothetical protein
LIIDAKNKIIFSRSEDESSMKAWLLDEVLVTLNLIDTETDYDAKLGQLQLFPEYGYALITNELY